MESDVFSNSWAEVENDYNHGLLNSERCLQASIYRALRAHAPETLTTFVEPELSYESEKCRPDLVICDGENVCAIVEIKFTPHWYPHYKRDIAKLRKLACTNIGHQISIDPETGKWSEVQHRVGRGTKFVFAVVAQHDAEALSLKAVTAGAGPNFKNRFLLLLGVIGCAHGPRFRLCP